MKIFELTWEWYEENYSFLFTHLNKSEEQFKEDVKLLFIKCGNEYLANEEEGWASMPDWTVLVAERMNELGYEPIKPVSYGSFGGFIIDNYDDNDDEEGIKEFIGKELLQKAIEHNSKLRKKLDN